LQRIEPAPFIPTLVKKRENEEAVEKTSSKADPENEGQGENDLYKS